MRTKTSVGRKAFTLVELLVVIAIIGILVALLLPAIQAARESARRSQCQNQLKQMGLALNNYHDARKGYPTGRNGRDEKAVSWAFLILPYMEEQAIFDSFKKGVRVDDPANALAMRSPIAGYVCPSRRSPGADRDFDNGSNAPVVKAAGTRGDYAANAGLEEDMGTEINDFVGNGVDLTLAGPMFTFSKMKASRVTDGLSKTLAAGERHIPLEQSDWDPERIHVRQADTAFLAGNLINTVFRGTEDGLAEGPNDDSDQKFGSEHPGLVMFVFLDGHVESFSTSESKTATGVNPNGVGDINVDDPQWLWLMALSTVAGGEVVQ